MCLWSFKNSNKKFGTLFYYEKFNSRTYESVWKLRKIFYDIKLNKIKSIKKYIFINLQVLKDAFPYVTKKNCAFIVFFFAKLLFF